MGRMTVMRFLREQWVTIPMPTGDARGKSIVVVGANGGLGLEAAKHLAMLSPEDLLLTSRDMDRAKDSSKVIEDANISNQNIEWGRLDLSSFDSVRTFANRFGNKKINCLLANAGIATRKYVQTEDGWESTYVSSSSVSFLPALDKPENSSSHGSGASAYREISSTSTNQSVSRIAIVSSDAHYQIKSLGVLRDSPHILAFANERKYCTAQYVHHILVIFKLFLSHLAKSLGSIMAQRYMFSKLLVVAFIRELAARLASPTPVVVSAVNPGLCHSRLTREAESQIPGKWVMPTFKSVFARSTETGGLILVHALTDPDERRFHGHYVSNCEVAEESDLLLGADGVNLSRRIWDETIGVLEAADPRVTQIVSQYLRPLGQDTGA
ncbi:hypothetical protein EW146_g2206 [Bondarzewia mesenterica]|uniref:Ketoreductase (KR) domain-containing protein n=1 Tax=Bondarzewia mesenterica TaxID=1095465 RepID=A0A4V3XFV1_9AGAM|nr:hypothetical protein EW146_g2206 [Bondarzewia mesenterica]